MTLPPKPSQGECKSNRFFENQRNEISSYLSQKLQKCRLFGRDISSKISLTKEKERRKRKSEAREGNGREQKKAMVALLVFIMATLENCWTQKVHLAVTFSKIRLEIRCRFPAP